MNLEWPHNRLKSIFAQNPGQDYLKPIFYMFVGALLTMVIFPFKVYQNEHIASFTELCGGASLASSDKQFYDEMNQVMAKMNLGMSSAPMTGSINHDFALMMIPHHQGAIDMAKNELSYGNDPVMRRLAEEIIVDQQSEIDVMNLWLKKQAATGK